MGDNTVHIIGAGPSGLAAALYLARVGLKPIVFEQQNDVGMGFHNNVQVLDNWSTEEDILALLAGLGIGMNYHCEPLSSVTFIGPERNAYPMSGSRPFGYAISRGPGQFTLDQGLKTQAEAAGATFRFGQRIEVSDADPVIMATGAQDQDATIAQCTFLTNSPDSSLVILNDQLSQAGFATLFIRGGRATLTSTSFLDLDESETHLAQTTEWIVRHLGIHIGTPPTIKDGNVNFSIPPPWTQSGNRFLVGARAGFQDALTGFGLRHALISGVLAARAIAMKEDYNQLCRAFVEPSIKVSLANRAIFSQLGDNGYEWGLRRAAGSNATGILRRHYQTSVTKSLLYEIARMGQHPWSVDPSCHEPECTCLSCEHGRQSKPVKSKAECSSRSKRLTPEGD